MCIRDRGNSGSPIINVKREVVGLVFDGNIESLPGKFIFDEKDNRTVAVHAGGIVAALRYICLLYTSPSPRDRTRSRMPSSA